MTATKDPALIEPVDKDDERALNEARSSHQSFRRASAEALAYARRRREAVVKLRKKGHSAAEVAALLGITRQAVDNLVRRGEQ